MARPRTTGSLEWVGDPAKPKPTDHWRCRVVMNGKRKWMRLPPSVRHDQRAKAEKLAHSIAADARAGKLRQKPPPAPAVPTAPAPEGETFETWCGRWLKARRARGLTSVRNDECRLKKWVWPRLGAKPTTSITKADVEDLVTALDRAIASDKLGWKTASSVWGLVSKAFSDACSAKDRSLRVREDNPARDVVAPDRGVRKGKVYLWPSEFLALMRYEKAPLNWRRTFAVAVYTYARAGELHALDFDALDLAHGTILIHQAIDYDTDELKSTKGKQTRRFALEPEILPLLHALCAERGGKGRVLVPFPPQKDLAERLREYLEGAGVTRRELFETTRTTRALTFHDLRSTGITWMAVRGDPPLQIQHRAGHESLSTTQDYIREAEAVRPGFGTVFPPLPIELLGGFVPGNVPAGSSRNAKGPVSRAFQRCEEGDLNPHGVTR